MSEQSAGTMLTGPAIDPLLAELKQTAATASATSSMFRINGTPVSFAGLKAAFGRAFGTGLRE